MKNQIIKFKLEKSKSKPVITIHSLFYKLPKDARKVVLSELKAFIKSLTNQRE